MRLITSKCLLTTGDIIFVMGFLGSTILFVIYQERINSMVVYIVYGILLGCFCIRHDPEVIDSVRNGNRIFPIETNNNPIIVVSEQV